MASNPVPTNGIAASDSINTASKGKDALAGYMKARSIASQGKPTEGGVAKPQSGNRMLGANDHMRGAKGKGQNAGVARRRFLAERANDKSPPTTQGRVADFLQNFRKSPQSGVAPTASSAGPAAPTAKPPVSRGVANLNPGPTPLTSRPPAPTAGVKPPPGIKPPVTKPPSVPNSGLAPGSKPAGGLSPGVAPPRPIRPPTAVPGGTTAAPVATSRPPVTGGPTTTPPAMAKPAVAGGGSISGPPRQTI